MFTFWSSNVQVGHTSPLKGQDGHVFMSYNSKSSTKKNKKGL